MNLPAHMQRLPDLFAVHSLSVFTGFTVHCSVGPVKHNGTPGNTMELCFKSKDFIVKEFRIYKFHCIKFLCLV